MATLEELIVQRDSLLEIRRKGIRSYQIVTGTGSSRWLTYRSDDELAAAIADIDRQISRSQSGGHVSQIRISSTKGF